MSKYIVTMAPPNPNGDLHLGHLSGPFLGADVQARFLSERGDDVTHVGYIDEHSCYVVRRARELGAAPHETAHRLGNRIETTLNMALMNPDFMGRPHRDAWHDEIVQRFFLRLWEEGCFKIRDDAPVYYCPREETYLYEAEIRGKCHYCAAPSDGFYCEECGRPQESGSLAEPLCTTCWEAPELRSHRRIVFELERWRSALIDFYSRLDARPRLREYLEMTLSHPLPDTPVSRVGNYGVEVPIDGWEGHYLDTWFSGIWGYVAATEGARNVVRQGGGADDWLDPETKVLEFLGFDCSYSHAVLWVAFALALPELVVPTQIVTNEFYMLDGGKFSTSRGHAIWGGDILSALPVDSLRFYLCLTGPELRKTNFTMPEFEETVGSILEGGLEPLARAVSRVSESSGSNERSRAVLDRTRTLHADVGTALDPARFSPSRAAGAVATYCRELRPGVEALCLDRATSDEVLTLLASSLAPMMPGWSNDVFRAVQGRKADLNSAAGMAGTPGWHIDRQGLSWPIRSLAVPRL